MALAELGTAEPLHIDLETTGLDPLRGDVVGVGLANSKGCFYFDARGANETWWTTLAVALDQAGMVAFNAMFDYAWVIAQLSHKPGWFPKLAGCSLVAFKLAANEGYPGQSHSLKVAQTTVLRWPDSNKDELEELLVRHGVVTGNGNPDKDRMSELAELEPEAFGRYCAHDALASYQLWTEILEQADAGQTTLRRWLTQDWPCEIRLLVEQQLAGLPVDEAALVAYEAALVAEIQAAEQALREHPRIAPHIAELEAQRTVEFFAPQVTIARQKLTQREALELGCVHEDGSVSLPDGIHYHPSTAKTLAKWQQAIGGYLYREIRTERPRNEGRPAPRFNFESDPDLRWLLYERVYRAEQLPPDPERQWAPAKCRVTTETGSVEVELTDGGAFPVGKAVLPALGEIGALLGELNALTKRHGYVKAYRAGAAEGGGKLHLRFRPAGAATGRIVGG